MMRAARVVALAVVLGGCAVPSWMPLLGRKGPLPPAPVAGKPLSPDMPMPGDVRIRPTEHDDGVADRVVAVVNNDAITLSELQETIVAYRAENRQGRGGGPSDDELAKQFLPKLIDGRLQLQEAERERITVEDHEVTDEIAERIKMYNTKSVEEFEKLIKEQGITACPITRGTCWSSRRARTTRDGRRRGSRRRSCAHRSSTAPTSRRSPASPRRTPAARTVATWALSSAASWRRTSRARS